MRFIAAIFLFTVPMWTSAQFLSEQGRFQVDQIKGCAPFTITLTNLQAGSCTTGSPCAMDYLGNGQTQQNVFTFTYPNPGTFNLSVLYQNTGADRITITVVQNISPAFDVYRCAGNGASIKITDNSYDQYVIDFDGALPPENIIPKSNNQVASFNYGSGGAKNITVRGRNLSSADNCNSQVETFTAINALPAASFTSLQLLNKTQLTLDFNPVQDVQHRLEIAVNGTTSFQQVATLYEASTYTVGSLNTEDNFYCFRLASYDPCNNTSVYSNVICSNRLSLNIQSAVNQLSWITASTGIQSVSILRDQNAYVNLPGAPTGFNDVDIVCNTDYCYQVVTNYTNGAKSFSFERCGTSFTITTPTPISNASAVVSEGSADLTWIQDPPDQPSLYSVIKISNGQNFGAIATSDGLSYSDKTYTTGSSTCYRIEYTDDCGNNSPAGALICPMEMQGTMDEQNVITLNWSRYVGWNGGVASYRVEKYAKDGSLIKSFNVGTDTTFVDDEDDPQNQLVTYRIVALANQAGLTNSVSNPLSFIKENNLFFPTAFSPNGDKLNDRFSISGQFIVKIELEIFNRWGEMVYSSSDNEPWDGSFKGKPAQEDAYVWSANVTDLAGRTFKRRGTVALIRRKK